MARKIASRLLIKGTLTALTPLHVGGYGTSPDTDLPLAQNGRGEWYMPGTSLTGVIRAWCERACPNENFVTYLFGPPMQRGDEDSGHASFVLIEDAVIHLQGKPIETRDGVGIDRVLGVAAENIKFDRAVLPRGSQLDFQMTIEIAAQKKDETKEQFQRRAIQTRAIAGHLLAALQNEELRFGAARTRGLGRAKLKLQELNEQTVNNRDGILKVLRGESEARTAEELQSADSAIELRKQPRLEVEIKWKPKGALMVKAGYEGVGVDMLPLVSSVNDGVALVLPGSSLKGTLRSHAERIVRTVKPPEDQVKTISGMKFADQIEVKLINELFGARNKSKAHKQGGNGANNKTPQLGLGALSVDDCYALKPMNPDAWQFVERATAKPDEDSRTWELRKAIDPSLEPPIADEEGTNDVAAQDSAKERFAAVKEHRFEISHHVAIDRWTGGASEGALFSVLAPHSIEWEEMRLTIDLTRIPKEEHLACIALLLFVLRDLMQERIPLGFATNRGMGEIEIEQIHLHTNLQDFPESITLTPPKESEWRSIFSEFEPYVMNNKKLLKKLSDEWQYILGLTPNHPTPDENGGQA
jgi:CRISPR/Cas system CSM-associated protein Csm3 (group 7 of RAMP superfamily)